MIIKQRRQNWTALTSAVLLSGDGVVGVGTFSVAFDLAL